MYLNPWPFVPSSCRILANKQILLYLFVLLYLLSWLLGSGLVFAALVFLLICSLVVLSVAAGRTLKRAAKSHSWGSLANDSLDASKAD